MCASPTPCTFPPKTRTGISVSTDSYGVHTRTNLTLSGWELSSSTKSLNSSFEAETALFEFPFASTWLFAEANCPSSRSWVSFCSHIWGNRSLELWSIVNEGPSWTESEGLKSPRKPCFRISSSGLMGPTGQCSPGTQLSRSKAVWYCCCHFILRTIFCSTESHGRVC